MGRHIIIEEAPDALDHAALREQLETKGCGAIVSFLGITRGTEGDAEVYALEFDAWQEKLGPVLRDLANQACDTFGTLSVVMAHRTGRVEPQESIVSIHVASPIVRKHSKRVSGSSMNSRNRLHCGNVK